VETAAILRAEPRARTRAVADRVRVVAVMMFLRIELGFYKRFALACPSRETTWRCVTAQPKFFSKILPRVGAAFGSSYRAESKKRHGRRAVFFGFRNLVLKQLVVNEY
jgi:hypothetical protein